MSAQTPVRRVGAISPELHEILIAARMVATELAPYYATALYRLKPVATPGLGTVAVDKWWRLYIDPDAFESWSKATRALALIHEVSHVIRAHADRCTDAGYNHRLYNICADAEINDDLDGLRPPQNEPIPFEGVPDNWVTPERLQPPMPDGLLAETYYQSMVDNAVQAPEQGDCDECGGTGSQGSGGNSPETGDDEASAAGSDSRATMVGERTAPTRPPTTAAAPAAAANPGTGTARPAAAPAPQTGSVTEPAGPVPEAGNGPGNSTRTTPTPPGSTTQPAT
jgi:hypothetical protein